MRQTSYAEFVVAQFEEKYCAGRRLKGISTPMDTNEKVVSDEDVVGMPSDMPSLQEVASSLEGEMWWLSRGTRPDMVAATNRLARRIKDWGREDDKAMYRLMRSLKGTVSMGLLFRADVRDLASLIAQGEADADHASDPRTTRSCSGYATLLAGPRGTKVLVDWSSKTQTATSRSTGEAEVVACSDATFRSALPLTAIVERLVDRRVRVVMGTGASAAHQAIEKGYSKKLAHLDKHQRVSIAATHEVYYASLSAPAEADGDEAAGSLNVLHKIGTAENRGDLFTKPLPHEAHWRHVWGLGMVARPRARL